MLSFVFAVIFHADLAILVVFDVIFHAGLADLVVFDVIVGTSLDKSLHHCTCSLPILSCVYGFRNPSFWFGTLRDD